MHFDVNFYENQKNKFEVFTRNWPNGYVGNVRELNAQTKHCSAKHEK